MDFEYSAKTRELASKLDRFMREHVYPNEKRHAREVAEGDRWQPTALIEELKARARSEGLWNLFLPQSASGAGLTNAEYAPLCEIMGRVPWAPEVFNCSAPTRATWRRWSATARRIRSAPGSSRCSRARSAPRSQ